MAESRSQSQTEREMPTGNGNKKVKFRSHFQRKFFKKGPDGASEYQDRFRWFTFMDFSGKLKPKSPPVYGKDKEKMDLQTSYDKNYVQHQIKMRMKPKQKPYRPPDGKMNTKTAYQETFTKKVPIDSAPYIPNLPFRLPAKRTDLVSEYQSVFVPMESTPSKPSKMGETLELPKGKFNEVSTIQHDYKEHKNFKRVYPIYQGSREVSGNFQVPYVTTYRESYATKEHKVRLPKVHKSRGKDGPHFTDAVPADGPPPRPLSFPDYKPKQLKAMTAFDAVTTQKSDYKRWPTMRKSIPFWVKELGVKPPEGGMQLHTTYGTDFSDPKIVCSLPPAVSLAERKKKSMEAPKDMTLSFPESIHKAHFTGQYAPAAKPCPPASDNWQASTCGKVPFCTTYRESFVGESEEQRRIRRLNMKRALESGVTEEKSSAWKWEPSGK